MGHNSVSSSTHRNSIEISMCVCVCVHGHFQVYNLRIISQKMSTRFLRFSEWANDIRVEVYRKIPENFQRLLENF